MPIQDLSPLFQELVAKEKTKFENDLLNKSLGIKIELDSYSIKAWRNNERISCYENKGLDLNKIVLEPNKDFQLYIDYPLTNPATIPFNTGKNGFTRKNLIDFVCKSYRDIYVEEKKTTKIKVGWLENSYNRNTTDGKYGIWGHTIGDLYLNDAYLCGNKITLSIDS